MSDLKPRSLEYRRALPEDAGECLVVRGKTRQNPASEERLQSIGVTPESWAENIRFGARAAGEIQVIALLPDFEERGIGRELLDRTSRELAGLGHTRLFLACNPDLASRSYGFYRHLGWRSTGTFDQFGDEILEILVESDV